MKFSELLQKCQLTPKLVFILQSMHRKFTSQLRQSLGRLGSITKVDIQRLFTYSNLEVNDFNEVLTEYPTNVYVMQHPIYSLLTLFMLKAYQEGNPTLASDINILLALVMLGRRKYKYIRFVDQEIFEKTLSSLSKKTYIGLHGTIWMVNNIAQTAHDKYIQQILNNVDDVYPRYRYINDIYNRFNQIMKVIAHHYYYNVQHRNDVPREVIVKKRAAEVVDYILEHSVSESLINYIANISNSTTDRMNELYHIVQTYSSAQNQLQIIITIILDKLLSYFDILREQLPDVKIDINDPKFINSFVNKLKRSTIVLKEVSSSIFTQYGFERFEVLYFSLVLTLYVDVMNHYQEYFSKPSTVSSNDSTNDDSEEYDDFEDSVDSYDENIEALFDGIILDEMIYLK